MKPGPRAYKPTATQCRRVMRGVAAGLTLPQLAAEIDMPERTMRRVFAASIKIARTRLILDNLDRLHDAADGGNVAAMRQLASMMMLPTAEPDGLDTWDDVVAETGDLARNRDFH
jgi:hypothetical protein